MRRILITISIFLLTSTVTGYAGFFDEKSDNKQSDAASNSDYKGGFFSNSESGNEIEKLSHGGFFRASPTDPDDPGDRPGSGDGIGQEAPLGDGTFSLIACCTVLGIIKIYKERKKNRQ